MIRAYASVWYERQVEKLGEALYLQPQDWQIVRDKIDSEFRAIEAEIFAAEGGNTPWPELKPATLARKQGKRARIMRENKWTSKLTLGNKIGAFTERAVSTKILRYSENMMRSLTRAGHSEHVAQIESQFTPPRVTVGTMNKLAGYHFHGNPDNNLPVRNPIDLRPLQKAVLVEAPSRYLLEKVKAVMRSLRRATTAKGIRS